MYIANVVNSTAAAGAGPLLFSKREKKESTKKIHVSLSPCESRKVDYDFFFDGEFWSIYHGTTKKNINDSEN
jgi:hypothetical protein